MKFEPKSIIIFNPFGIGDVIFSTPLIKPLKDAYPGVKIHYICNKRVKSVLEKNPLLDNVFVYEKDDFRELARKSKLRFIVRLFKFFRYMKRLKADLFIDLSLNYRSGFLAKLLNIPVRVGFDYRERGSFLTKKLALEGFMNKHVVLYNFDLLGLLGIQAEVKAPKIYVSSEDEQCAENFICENRLQGKTIVGIIPGGGRSWGEDSRYRRWPVANFAHLTDKLIDERKFEVIILGDKSEEQLCMNLGKLVKNKVYNLGGKTSVGQFMAIISKCKFVFCNEGGPLHIAVALDIPTVSIFGPVDEKVYGPFAKEPGHHIVVTERAECKPCYTKFKHKKCELIQCINSLSVDKVYGAINDIIKRLG